MLEYSDYTSALNMTDSFTCLTGFRICFKFCICQGPEYGTVVYAKGYTRVL